MVTTGAPVLYPIISSAKASGRHNVLDRGDPEVTETILGIQIIKSKWIWLWSVGVALAFSIPIVSSPAFPERSLPYGILIASNARLMDDSTMTLCGDRDRDRDRAGLVCSTRVYLIWPSGSLGPNRHTRFPPRFRSCTISPADRSHTCAKKGKIFQRIVNFGSMPAHSRGLCATEILDGFSSVCPCES